MSLLTTSDQIVYLAATTLVAAGIIASAIYIVRAKSLFYSAFALGIIGFLNAALFALMGYLLVGAVQLVIYVGAAVLFIILAFSLVGEQSVPPRITLLHMILAVLVFVGVLLFTDRVVSTLPAEVSFTTSPTGQVARALVVEYDLTLVLIILVAATSAIESIVMARREFMSSDKRG